MPALCPSLRESLTGNSGMKALSIFPHYWSSNRQQSYIRTSSSAFQTFPRTAIKFAALDLREFLPHFYTAEMRAHSVQIGVAIPARM